ncbi:MAG: CDP-alcohol phosphatidyltransferase family protein [Clostridia bacterium]|nr:CDP-alcohol phosphatidyltransferase family protein [Clostridia bacterium]
MSYSKKEVLTIPNILSIVRLIMIPIFAVLYIKAETAKEYLVSALVLTASVLTDMLDGIIARKCNMVSRLGIMLDPFADKVTQGIVMICLMFKHSEIIPLFVLFFVKEMFMLVMGCLHLKKKKMLDGALLQGKICTVVLFAGMIVIMAFNNLPSEAISAIVAVCSVFMMISFVSYAVCYFKKSPRIKDIE